MKNTLDKLTAYQILTFVQGKSELMRCNYIVLSPNVTSQAIVSYHKFINHVCTVHGMRLFMKSDKVDLTISMYDKIDDKPNIIETSCSGLISAINIAVSAFNRSRHERVTVSAYMDSVADMFTILSYESKRSRVIKTNGSVIQMKRKHGET